MMDDFRYPAVPIAHSERVMTSKSGRTWVVEAQTYLDHVRNVEARAVRSAEIVARHLPEHMRAFLVNTVRLAAVYHDLGKLLVDNQKALTGFVLACRLPRAHAHIGEAYLLKGKSLESRWAAMLIACHHPGIYDMKQPFWEAKTRCCPERSDDPSQIDSFYRPPSPDDDYYSFTDEEVEFCVRVHDRVVGRRVFATEYPADFGDSREGRDFLRTVLSPMYIRFAMSCLGEADHGDTSEHYYPPKYRAYFDLRADERLAHLKRVLEEEIAKGSMPLISSMDEARQTLVEIAAEQKGGAMLPFETLRRHRLLLRQIGGVFAESYELNGGVTICGYPVGSGKTLSVPRTLLRRAKETGASRVFYVSPFTSIIDQVTSEYFKYVVLPDEREDEDLVVCRHDSRSDYKEAWKARFSTTWDAPFVVTTAVQFFETLASNSPVKLKKLRNLAGSLIFFDEFHALLRDGLVPLGFGWVSQLVKDFGCRVVMGSGSPVRYWDIPELNGIRRDVPIVDMLDGLPELAKAFEANEAHRVGTVPFGHLPPHLRQSKFQAEVSIDELVKAVASVGEPGGIKGPTMLLMNTLRGAAYLAREIDRQPGWKRWDKYKKKNGGGIVYHLSTAMSGGDREKVIAKVARRLKLFRSGRGTGKIILVATSCVEAGIDLSFYALFRQIASATSAAQVNGRGNRAYEYKKHARSYYFDLDMESRKIIPPNPYVFHSGNALRGQLRVNEWRREQKQKLKPFSEICTDAKQWEIDNLDPESATALERALRQEEERRWQFASLRKHFIVIQADCLTVISDAETANAMEGEVPPPFNEFQNSVVRINNKFIGKLPVREIQPLNAGESVDEEGGKNNEQDRTDDRLYRFTNQHFYSPFLGFMEGMLRVIEGDETALLDDEEEIERYVV